MREARNGLGELCMDSLSPSSSNTLIIMERKTNNVHNRNEINFERFAFEDFPSFLDCLFFNSLAFSLYPNRCIDETENKDTCE